jgi:regulatory protein
MAGRGGKRQGRKVTASSLENAALHYLERFASSTANLRRILLRRVRRSALEHETDPAEGAALVDALIERLIRSGVLDDRRYAEAKAQTLHRRGTSRRLLAGRLAQQGLDGALIDEALAGLAATTGDAELAAAAALARRRRLGPYRPEGAREAARSKDLASFARAGFSLDMARRILACAGPDAVEAMVREGGG